MFIEKNDEKSLYDYESVRKLMNDLEKSKNKNSDNELNESNNNNENLTGSDNKLIETILPVKDVEIKIEICLFPVGQKVLLNFFGKLINERQKLQSVSPTIRCI